MERRRQPEVDDVLTAFPNRKRRSGTIRGRRWSKSLTNDVHVIFRCGSCVHLAIVMSHRLDAPVVVVKSPNDPTWIRHALVDLGDDRYLDIEGVSCRGDVERRWRGQVQDATSEDILRHLDPQEDEEFQAAYAIADRVGRMARRR